MEVKFLPEVHIERAANELIIGYGRKYGDIAAPPVPVEEMLECYLDLSLGFDDLPRLFNEPGILGATWIEEKRVLVDQSLDPAEHPHVLGRYRFTVAHEVGHWSLHRQQLARARSTPLLGGKPEPSIICRATAKKPPVEWQADCFAGYLLMPEDIVRRLWAQTNGSPAPYVAEEEIVQMSGRLGLGEDDRTPTVAVSKRMADAFAVSGQAMQIRLLKLGLLLTEKPPPSLFG